MRPGAGLCTHGLRAGPRLCAVLPRAMLPRLAWAGATMAAPVWAVIAILFVHLFSQEMKALVAV
jgi:hypothetical protein